MLFRSVSDGLWCVNCLDYDDLPAKLEEQLVAALREYATRLAQQDFQRWHEEVSRRLRPRQRAVWESIFAQEISRPRINLWINRDGGQP